MRWVLGSPPVWGAEGTLEGHRCLGVLRGSSESAVGTFHVFSGLVEHSVSFSVSGPHSPPLSRVMK